MISASSRIGDTTTYHDRFDIQVLEGILGSRLTITTKSYLRSLSIFDGKVVSTTGVFYEITRENTTYTISPGNFTKIVNLKKFKGNGSFEGPWDEMGKKIVEYFFSNHEKGSIIFFNGAKHRLKNKESSIELMPDND